MASCTGRTIVCGPRPTRVRPNLRRELKNVQYHDQATVHDRVAVPYNIVLYNLVRYRRGLKTVRMERSYKTRAYKEKKYGRSTRHVLVAAPKTIQDPAVPYPTVPYCRTTGGWSTVPYRTLPIRTAVTNTEKAPRLARFLYRSV